MLHCLKRANGFSHLLTTPDDLTTCQAAEAPHNPFVRFLNAFLCMDHTSRPRVTWPSCETVTRSRGHPRLAEIRIPPSVRAS